MIADVISPDLALKDLAAFFFKDIEISGEKNVKVDFKGVESITRSFAQEYLNRKMACRVSVTDINVPDNVKKMFLTVSSNTKETRFPGLNDVSIVPL